MSTEAPDFTAIGAQRKSPQDALQEVALAAEEDLALGPFCERVLSRAVQTLNALGGVVWILNDEGHLSLIRESNLAGTNLLENATAEAAHAGLLQAIIEGGPAALVKPNMFDDERRIGNPTNQLLILAPIDVDKRRHGILEIFQRPEVDSQLQVRQLQFVLQVCSLAGDYFKTQRLRQLEERLSAWSRYDAFARHAHRDLDLAGTCYAIANEGRRVIDCDRLSFAVKMGRGFQIQAISGQDTFNPRSSAITLLNQLATIASAAGDEVWYGGSASELSPQVEKAVQAYVDESHSATLVVIPLRRPAKADGEKPDPSVEEPVVGTLIAETFDDRDFSANYRQRVAMTATHSATALANVQEHRELFLMPVWRWLGKLPAIRKARSFPKVMTVAGILLAAFGLLCVIPCDFQLSGKGTLEPVVKRDVFAGLSGTVAKIVSDRGHVRAGDPLLLIDSPDVKTELLRLQGERDSKLQERLAKERLLVDPKLSEPEKVRIRGETQGLKVYCESLDEQIRLVAKEKVSQATVVSPIDGEIITWQVREKLDHRPVEKGQALLTVAALDQEWELEVQLPEDRLGFVREAQQNLPPGEALPVTFILSSDPGTKYGGTVKEIHRAAEVRGEEGNVVLVRVAIDKDKIAELRPGAGATVKFQCGRRSIAFVWFHDILGFIQAKILF